MPQVKISQIKPGMRNLSITGVIISVGETKTVETRFGPARVAQAILQDDTGTIILNLWRGQIEAVRPRDTVRIENAFVRTFGGRMELNIGHDGRITVVKGENSWKKEREMP